MNPVRVNWADAPLTVLELGDHVLHIKQNEKPVKSVSSVGFTVWAASLLLAKLFAVTNRRLIGSSADAATVDSVNASDRITTDSIEPKENKNTQTHSQEGIDHSVLEGFVENKSVIELGCGCGGIAGLAALLSGASSVCFSDRGDIVELCQQNVSENLRRLFPGSRGEELLAKCSFKELVWGQTDTAALAGTCQVILAADTIYLEKAVVPLLRCTRELCGHYNRGAVALFAFEHHDGIALRTFRRNASRYFDVAPVNVGPQILSSDSRFADSLMSVCLLRPREQIPPVSQEVSVSDSSDSDSLDFEI